MAMAGHDLQTSPANQLGLPTAQHGGRLDAVAYRPWVGRDVAVDPSSARVAIATGDAVILATVPDLGPGRELRAPGAHQVAFIPRRRLLAIAGPDGLRIRSLDRDAEPLRIRTPGPICAAVSDGGLIAITGRVSRPHATVGVWDLDRKGPLWTASVRDAQSCAWSPDGVLGVAGHGVSLFAWDGRVLPHFASPDPGPVTGICGFEPGFLFCGSGAAAHQWDLDRFEHARTLPVPRGGGRRSLSIWRGTLAAGNMQRGGVVALIDVESARVEWSILGARAAAFAGRHLVVTGEGGTTVYEWDPPGQDLA